MSIFVLPTWFKQSCDSWVTHIVVDWLLSSSFYNRTITLRKRIGDCIIKDARCSFFVQGISSGPNQTYWYDLCWWVTYSFGRCPSDNLLNLYCIKVFLSPLYGVIRIHKSNFVLTPELRSLGLTLRSCIYMDCIWTLFHVSYTSGTGRVQNLNC